MSDESPRKYPSVKRLVEMWEESLTVFELSGLRHRYKTDDLIFYRSCLSVIADLREPHRDPNQFLNCQAIRNAVRLREGAMLNGTDPKVGLLEKHKADCMFCGSSFWTAKARYCSKKCMKGAKRNEVLLALGVKQLAAATAEPSPDWALLITQY